MHFNLHNIYREYSQIYLIFMCSCLKKPKTLHLKKTNHMKHINKRMIRMIRNVRHQPLTFPTTHISLFRYHDFIALDLRVETLFG